MNLLIKQTSKFFLVNVLENLTYFDTPDNSSGGVFCMVNGKYTIFFNENKNIKVFNWLLNNYEIKDNHNYTFFINSHNLKEIIKYLYEIINYYEFENINVVFTPNLPYNNLLFTDNNAYRRYANVILTAKNLDHPYYHYDLWINNNILKLSEVNDELTISMSIDSIYLFLNFFKYYYNYKPQDKNITNIFISFKSLSQTITIFYIFNEFIYEYTDELLLDKSDIEYFINDEVFYYMYTHHVTESPISFKLETLYDNTKQIVYTENKVHLDTNVNIISKILSDGYDFHIPKYRSETIEFPIERLYTALKRFDIFAYKNSDCYVAELIFNEMSLWIIYEDGFAENVHIIEYENQPYITEDIKFKINIILLYNFVNKQIKAEDLPYYASDTYKINLSEDNKAFKIGYNLTDNLYYYSDTIIQNTLHIHTHID